MFCYRSMKKMLVKLTGPKTFALDRSYLPVQKENMSFMMI